MSYYVRPMRKEDIPQVNEIDREAFPTQWPPPNYRRELQNQLARLTVACDDSKTIEEPEMPAPPAGSISGLANRLKRLFCRERSGTELPSLRKQYLAGFASIWALADEAHLTNIAVRSHYQRQGIGELLLMSIIDLAVELNTKVITLEVRASNIAAQSLYRKYGFSQVGVRPSYYTDNREDGLIMTTESITSARFQAHFQQLKQAYTQRYGTKIEECIAIR